MSTHGHMSTRRPEVPARPAESERMIQVGGAFGIPGVPMLTLVPAGKLEQRRDRRGARR